MQPGKRRRATVETDKKEPKGEEPKVDQTHNADKKTQDPEKQGQIVKKNSILPAKPGLNKIALPATKQPTLDEDDRTEDSEIISKRNTINEKKFEMRQNAIIKKGNEEGRRSFHFKMNVFNLISSFLGLFGLALQMIEVYDSD